MSIPEVSIITPVYNGYHYIGSTAESVLSQTFGNFEWLIIDDSSTDGTHEILQELKKRDSRISLFRHEHNRGPIHARNLALEASRGRFIAFLDIDDNWAAGETGKAYRLYEGNRDRAELYKLPEV